MVVVKCVLTVFFIALNREIFFSASCNFATNFEEPVPPAAPNSKAELSPLLVVVVVPSSSLKLSSASDDAESVPSKSKKEASVLRVDNAISAEKFCPVSSSDIKTCLTSENELSLIEVIVKSVLPEFSTIKSVSEESDALIFSPDTKVPATFVRITRVPLVPSPKTNPVAPEVAPVT